MRKPVIIILCALIVSVFFTVNLSAKQRGIRIVAKSGESVYLYKNYHALVIGVSDYQKWPKLPNALSDAKEVATKLKELGFEVKLVLDPTSQQMKTALNVMIYNMGIAEDRALLLYYAGHGETETLADKTEMGYIIPRDCPLLKKDPMGFATHAISMRDIESASLRIKSKHVLMLFDSCFSGSLFSLVRAVPDDITEKSTLPVRQYITAGREDEQVPDRSMFKRCLLIGLDGDADLTGDGYITGSELGMYLSEKVVNYTHRGQHPQYGKINNPNLDRGDFIFVPLSLEDKLKAAEEQLRKEIAEKKALEEELKRLRAETEKTPHMTKELQGEQGKEKRLALIPKEVTDAKVPNGRFIAYDNGKVVDTKTSLEWIAGPDKGTSWDEAKSWVDNLSVAGGGWRMPTLKELESLYQKGTGKRNMTSLLKSTGWYVWSEEHVDLYAWYFDFKIGSDGRDYPSSSLGSRVFAVRSRR